MIMNVVVAGLMVLASDPGGGSGSQDVQVQSSQDGRTSRLSLKNSQIVISGNGAGGKSDGYRLKRPCWYEPAQDAEGMMKFQQQTTRVDPYEPKSRSETLEPFKEKLGKEGRWWTIAHDSSDPKGLSCQMSMDTYVFVPPNTTPPGGITLAELADIARAALTVPEPKIKLNPDVRSYVNLPTWVWLDNAGETTRSVTATLPGVMSATVVATLSDLTIESGTSDDRAEVKGSGAAPAKAGSAPAGAGPASAKAGGGCGPTGTPYAKGGTFTCGVTYRRASADQPRDVYTLTVTSVWNVAVQDNVVPVAYDPIQASATRDVEVGEVQTTVRGSG
ncbi:hypothetical protein OHA77_14440 [Streptosporangium sp. NBC_01639]|uniref:hypothetical protein n=1 Tax=Streptosporangium sp. NBC_01639 TaxID=2975948 RepID=UPI003869C606|nr:hypothetical protein OHA77_14440 [Streptosporangium sp. NBC_01639]